MGRYYYTDSGLEGKFGFGVQGSDAPELFGMVEDTSKIDYIVTEEGFDKRYLKKLASQYDISIKKSRVREDLDSILDEIDYTLDHLDNTHALTGTNELYDLRLGVIIYHDVLVEGACYMKADC